MSELELQVEVQLQLELQVEVQVLKYYFRYFEISKKEIFLSLIISFSWIFLRKCTTFNLKFAAQTNSTISSTRTPLRDAVHAVTLANRARWACRTRINIKQVRQSAQLRVHQEQRCVLTPA